MRGNEAVAAALEKRGITQWGVADFEATLPLLDCRAKSRLPQNPASVVVCLLGYYIDNRPHNLSRYAWSRDYHDLAKQLLSPAVEELQKTYPENAFAFFTDNSPIREVRAAYLAGLGFVGKNGLLINPRYGTYHFIAEIVTDLALEPSTPSKASCGDCRLCLDHCPLGALSGQGVNRSLCRSHISQKKGKLDPWEEEQLEKGHLVWGCDICGDVCPYNCDAQRTDIPAFLQDVQSVVDPDNLSALMKEKAFSYRGEQVLQRNLHILKRISAGKKPDAGE